jgi:hypothetical protein
VRRTSSRQRTPVTCSQAGRLAAGCQARARELGSLPDWARQRARAAGPRPRRHWRREHSSCHRRGIRSRQASDLARRRASGTGGLSRLRGNARAMSTAMDEDQAGGHALLR